MNVTLHKLHGAGNAYLVMNAAVHPSLPTARLAAAACRPRLGLGADGLARIAHRGGGRFDVDVFNADGSPSGVNGNALRCCGRWIHQEYGYGSMLLRQGLAISPVEVDNESVRIRFSITDPPRWAGAGAVSLFVVSIEASDVVVSVPRSTVPGAGPDAPAAARWVPPGQKVRQGSLVRVDRVERSRLEVRTFEVGVRNETLSSATGALAAVAAGQEFGWLSAGNVRVRSRGGELLVCPEGQGSDYWVDGQVEHVFSGEYRLDLRGSQGALVGSDAPPSTREGHFTAAVRGDNDVTHRYPSSSGSRPLWTVEHRRRGDRRGSVTRYCDPNDVGRSSGT